MRVQSIGLFNGYVSSRNSVQNLNNRQNTKVMQNPSFGTITGKLVGGCFGAAGGLAVLFALATGPIGWGALAAAAAAGAAAGGTIGEKTTGPDDPKSSGQSSGQ